MNQLDSYLAAVKSRADAATEGPWTADQDDETYWVETPEAAITDTRTMTDATFIAATRTDVPRLVEMLEVATNALNEIRAHARSLATIGVSEQGNHIVVAEDALAKLNSLAESNK